MAYYPIKCPYCLQVLSNRDVRFNLKSGVAGRSRAVRAEDAAPKEAPAEASGASAPAGDEYDDSSSWLGGGDQQAGKGDGPPGGGGRPDAGGGAGDDRRTAQTAAPTEGLFTFAELKKLFGDGNVKPVQNRDVYAPPVYRNAPDFEPELKNDLNDALMMGVDITTRENGKETTTRYMKRYCECGKELMNASGMKASYVILMLGPSSSGKTTFLIALHEELQRESGYLLPPEGSGSRGIAKLHITVLSGGGEGDTSLEKMSDDLFVEGKLPISTIAMDNEPLVLDVFVEFKGNISTNALLFLRDMPGELLIKKDKKEELHDIAYQFPAFDGFIMMIDPFTFSERSVFYSDGSVDTSDRDKLKYINNLNQVLTDTVTPFVGGVRIGKPTAMIITKGDHFFDTRNVQRLSQKGVERNFPVLTPYQKESYDKQYFGEIDRDVNRILSNLSKNVLNMLERNFSNPFYALVSALSKNPIGIESRWVTEKIAGGEEGTVERSFATAPNAIKPWRVTDPFIRMLMRLKIVPPFDEVEIRQPDMEPYELTLGRNNRYLDQVNKWGDTYCTAWKPLTGIALVTADQGKGAPRGKKK